MADGEAAGVAGEAGKVKDDETRAGGEPPRFKYSAALGKKGAAGDPLAPPVSGPRSSSTHGALVLGRQEDCDVVIDDPLLSRHHCRVSVGRAGRLLAGGPRPRRTRRSSTRGSSRTGRACSTGTASSSAPPSCASTSKSRATANSRSPVPRRRRFLLTPAAGMVPFS